MSDHNGDIPWNALKCIHRGWRQCEFCLVFPTLAPTQSFCQEPSGFLWKSVVTSGVAVAVGFPLFCSNKHGVELGLL